MADGEEHMHIGDLLPDEHNPRKHTPRNIGMLERSLQDVGFARSIVVDESMRVISGNGTVEAAAAVGLTRVRVVDADGEEIIAVRRRGLSEEQKIRLKVYDNRVGELSGWDAGVLASLVDDGHDLSGAWHDEELARELISQLGADEEEGFVVPPERVEEEPPETPSQFMVIVQCETEAERDRLMDILEHEGFRARRSQATEEEGQDRADV